MSDQELISCLCVTHYRVDKLRRAVACFQRQTHAARELVVVFGRDDTATRDFLAGVKEPTLRVVEVPYLPKPPLGALRNLAVQAAQGTYIAQWDDDDWHGPTRLAEQLRALADQRYSACALMRWVLYDELTRQAYVSGPRAWEASLVARREALPPYPELARGEDTPVVEQLMAQDQLIGLDSPHLYIYTYHGANTWSRAHWRRNIFPHAERLGPEGTQRVQTVLRGHDTAVDAASLQRLRG